jgi:hypothetical protein
VEMEPALEAAAEQTAAADPVVEMEPALEAAAKQTAAAADPVVEMEPALEAAAEQTAAAAAAAADAVAPVRQVRQCTLPSTKPDVMEQVKPKPDAAQKASGAKRKIPPKQVKKFRDGNLHDPEISPPPNSLDVDDEIAFDMTDHSHLYGLCAAERLLNRPTGAKKKDCIAKQKHVSWIQSDFMPYEEQVYAFHRLKEGSDEITAFYGSDYWYSERWKVLHNNEKDNNDGRRLAANHCMKSNPRLKDLVMNYVHLAILDGVVPADVFPCGGDGFELSITLLIALVDALRQQEHTDYNPKYFRVYEDYEGVSEELQTSHQNFNGASMFINFSWNNDHKLDTGNYNKKTGVFESIILPAMSIVIITGDFLHAGSANKSGAITRKFFLYLDPHVECRNQGTFLDNGKYVKDNFIYFSAVASHDM